MWLEEQAGAAGQGSKACSMGGMAVGGARGPDSQAGRVWFLGHAEQGLPLTDLQTLRKGNRKRKDLGSKGAWEWAEKSQKEDGKRGT